MENLKKLKIVVTAFGIALFVSVSVTAWILWQNHNWRGAVDTVSEQAGGQWALTCFRAGKLVIFEFSAKVAETNGMPVFSGRRDGPFDVWLYPDYADEPGQSRYAQRKMIEAFNTHMRDMYKNLKFFRQEGAAITNIVTNDNK